jgi:hypothetical protein
MKEIFSDFNKFEDLKNKLIRYAAEEILRRKVNSEELASSDEMIMKVLCEDH